MTRTHCAAVVLTIVALFSHASQADLVAQYNFIGLSGTPTDVSGTGITGVTVSLLTRGSGLTQENATDAFNSSAWTPNSSFDATDYYAFTITPDLGATMSLDRISFDERRSNTGIRTFEIRSSLDNYGAAITGTVTTVPDNAGTRDQSFALPASFASLTDATTFRIYGYSSEATGGTWRLSNYTGSLGSTGGLTVDGTVVAVPEASVVLFGGLASCLGGGFYALRRWKSCKHSCSIA